MPEANKKNQPSQIKESFGSHIVLPAMITELPVIGKDIAFMEQINSFKPHLQSVATSTGIISLHCANSLNGTWIVMTVKLVLCVLSAFKLLHNCCISREIETRTRSDLSIYFLNKCSADLMRVMYNWKSPRDMRQKRKQSGRL